MRRSFKDSNPAAPRRRIISIIAIFLGISTTGACSSTAAASVAYPPAVESATAAAYPKLPQKPSSKVYRTVLKIVPHANKRAFYGNYGGPGSHGGAPVDVMDELFRRHDLVYHQSRCAREMIAADKGLVKALQAIDPKKLDDKGRAFRKRAVAFFKSPVARVTGKPFLSLFRGSERGDSWTRTEDAIMAFMLAPTNLAVSSHQLPQTAFVRRLSK